MDLEKTLRGAQLKILGWIAILIAPICWAVISIVYGMPFPLSISETATTGNIAAYLLPFCLGALAIFSFSYSRLHSYDYLPDKVLTAIMGIGFLIVALFPTASQYVYQDRVGILGVSEALSHFVHVVGALLGFGAMIIWILLCFTKSNRPPMQQTFEKRIRNIAYLLMGSGMFICLVLFILFMAGVLASSFAIVFWLEAIILLFAGLCCLIKGGAFLRDDSISRRS